MANEDADDFLKGLENDGAEVGADTNAPTSIRQVDVSGLPRLSFWTVPMSLRLLSLPVAILVLAVLLLHEFVEPDQFTPIGETTAILAVPASIWASLRAYRRGWQDGNRQGRRQT